MNKNEILEKAKKIADKVSVNEIRFDLVFHGFIQEASTNLLVYKVSDRFLWFRAFVELIIDVSVSLFNSFDRISLVKELSLLNNYLQTIKINFMKKSILSPSLYAFLVIFIILSSCEKGITGKIIDNFNKPVENVEIKIKNSGFQAKSNSNGNFFIDYAAGNITIEFSKEDYITTERDLNISEKQNYPMEQINMIRIPKTNEVFIKGADDFVRIPMVMMEEKCKTLAGSFGLPYKECTYTLPKDSFFIYRTDSINGLSVYSAFPKPVALLLMQENNYVMTYTYGNTIPGRVVGKAVNVDIKNLGSVSEVKFIPEYDKVYAFIILDEKPFTVTTSPIGFAFKIARKN